jgi:E3 ubiquitin-protein ligase BAH
MNMVLELMCGSTVNIDPALINFLAKYFPDEVKAKQKLNERIAAIDQFGEEYVNARCSLM